MEVKVFAYGSNMCAERMRARVANAVPIAIGYVMHRRLAFHKRGSDGSAKVDAVYSGRASDCVWGVVYSMSNNEKAELDGHEPGYTAEAIVVHGNGGTHSALMYVARAEAIDGSLKPYAWYHRFVLHGAVQQRLPLEYIERLRSIESIADPDRQRHDRNARLLDR